MRKHQTKRWVFLVREMCLLWAVSSHGERLFWTNYWELVSSKSNRGKAKDLKCPNHDIFVHNWTWLPASNGETWRLIFSTRSPKSLKSDPIYRSGCAICFFSIFRERLTTAHLTPEDLLTNSLWTKLIPNPEHLKFLQAMCSPKKRLVQWTPPLHPSRHKPNALG